MGNEEFFNYKISKLRKLIDDNLEPFRQHIVENNPRNNGIKEVLCVIAEFLNKEILTHVKTCGKKIVLPTENVFTEDNVHRVNFLEIILQKKLNGENFDD